MMARRGFTLIEILVVIVVIAILIGLLMPALGAARKQSRLQVCVSNARQQVMAIAAYTVDNADAMPPNRMSLVESDGSGGFVSGDWLVNSFLARYGGEPFPFAPGAAMCTPTGAWRCPEVPVDRDQDRFTHQGFLHHAPNGWLFNSVTMNEQLGTLGIDGLMLPGWDRRYSARGWRTASMVTRPSSILELMDNVNYYVPSHGHRDARTDYEFGADVVLGDGPGLPGNLGSHDDLGRRPAAMMDGHAEALPSSPDYWLQPTHAYYPPAGSQFQRALSEREVERLLWFVDPSDLHNDD